MINSKLNYIFGSVIKLCIMKVLFIALWFLLVAGVFISLTDLVDGIWLRCFDRATPEQQIELVDKIEGSGVDATKLRLMIK